MLPFVGSVDISTPQLYFAAHVGAIRRWTAYRMFAVAIAAAMIGRSTTLVTVTLVHATTSLERCIRYDHRSVVWDFEVQCFTWRFKRSEEH